MTITELAKECGVSPATVSKSFSGSPEISEKTRKMVFEKAKETGCFGKYYRGKYFKRTIALVVPEMNSVFQKYIKGFVRAIETEGWIPLISVDSFNESKTEEFLTYYSQYFRLDGIILFVMAGNKTPLLAKSEVPIVTIDTSAQNTPDNICFDFDEAIEIAVNHLISLGHRQIAYFGEKLTVEKNASFQKLSQKFSSKFKFTSIISPLRFEQCGALCTERLLSSGENCTGIICAYDHMAIGAINALKKYGYLIPEDFSVIGMDNIEMCDNFDPTISTVDFPADKICTATMEILRKKIINPYYVDYSSPLIKAKLVARNSTSKAKNAYLFFD